LRIEVQLGSGRLIALLLFVVLACWIWRGSRRVLRGGGGKSDPAPAEDMVCCAQCGVHLPRSEGLAGEGDSYYCSAEHQRLHNHSG